MPSLLEERISTLAWVPRNSSRAALFKSYPCQPASFSIGLRELSKICLGKIGVLMPEPLHTAPLCRYEKGTLLGRCSLTSGCRTQWAECNGFPCAPLQLPSPLATLMQGTAYIYNSYEFHYSLAVVTSNIMNKTATIRIFKLKIYNFQQHLDDMPLSETCW